MSEPWKRAAGAGLSSLVRGRRARYIQSRGRWNSGASALSKRSSQAIPSRAPKARPGPIAASPTPSHSPPPARGAATVTFWARGPPAAASKSVNQSEPVGAAPGRLWTV